MFGLYPPTRSKSIVDIPYGAGTGHVFQGDSEVMEGKDLRAEALRLGGKKGLYSSAWYDEQTFWTIYNRPRYEALKAMYDPNHGFNS